MDAYVGLGILAGERMPPFIPKALTINGDGKTFDFSLRLFDLPCTIRFDLLTDEELNPPKVFSDANQLQRYLKSFLEARREQPEQQDQSIEEAVPNNSDQLDKTELFHRSGNS